MENKELTAIDKILAEDNEDNIILYDENDNPTEFEQVAVIPLEDNVYVILVPVTPIEGVGEDEGIVFVIEETEDGELLTVVEDDEIADEVFEIYNGLVDAEDGE
ncbi:MAG: DUF1292 domain-containing protein [Clostridia bacterium]|nr:DUF1292 domain-containing protein [Clostridia bacterium]